jgi:class 3 adenylate cyclase
MTNSISKKQLLKRIAALVSDNKYLKESNRALIEKNATLIDKLDALENNSAKADDSTQHIYRQKRFDMVTVMYLKIRMLSQDTEDIDNMSKQIDKLDEMIYLFQNIAKKYNLLKMRSSGDYFICAGGIPERNNTNPVIVVLAALEMLNTMDSNKKNTDNLEMNIGIHTGSVTALISESGNYTLTGDTMHKTNSIVDNSTDNKIVVSEYTYELIKELFDCHKFGYLPVKYQMYLGLFKVTGLLDAFSDCHKKYIPNEIFRIKLMLIQFIDLQELILNKLEKELPQHLYYHNVKHTVDVVTQSELIGWAEGLNDHDLLLLKTAALFHDAGHTISYANHEEMSVKIAQEILPKYDYSQEEIDRICKIIMATKLPAVPSDLLESIICDSDLDYLGRIDFIPVSNTLYDELKIQNPSLTLNKWNELQVKFISSHQYFTKTGRDLRNVNKNDQIERIKQLIV